MNKMTRPPLPLPPHHLDRRSVAGPPSHWGVVLAWGFNWEHAVADANQGNKSGACNGKQDPRRQHENRWAGREAASERVRWERIGGRKRHGQNGQITTLLSVLYPEINILLSIMSTSKFDKKQSVKSNFFRVQRQKECPQVNFPLKVYRLGFAMVHSNNCGPLIWIPIITYYLLRGNSYIRKIYFY